MDTLSLNTSKTSTESDETLQVARFSDPHLKTILDSGIQLIMALGIVGNVFVYLLARYMVQVEKRPG